MKKTMEKRLVVGKEIRNKTGDEAMKRMTRRTSRTSEWRKTEHYISVSRTCDTDTEDEKKIRETN